MDALFYLPTFIQAHWMLWALLGGIALVLVGYEKREKDRHGVKISPHDAVSLINHENAAILDIRMPERFEQGHLLNAVCVKAEDCSNPDLENLKEKPVIFVCQRGISAYSASAHWVAAGFKNLRVLEGGIEAWQAAGLPLVKKGK